MGRRANRSRRRLAALGAAAVVAAGVGAALGAGAGDDPGGARTPERPAARESSGGGVRPPRDPDRDRAAEAAAAVRRLSPQRLAGSAVILRFSGTPPPADVLRALRAGRAAGVVLFQDNVPTPAATRRVTAALRRAGGGRAIVCLDQEGGGVRVLPWAAPRAGQPLLATPAAARAAATAAGRDLRRLGVNLSLAPVADVGRPGSALAGRAFPGGPAAVARLVAASVHGYAGTRVAPTIKHFPGLGAATANTDDVPVTIRTAARTLGARDLPPFRAGISAGAPAVMIGHARYPSLDPAHVASQSAPIVTGLLRRRLGFRGVAMTDSLEAQAAGARDDPGAAAVRSVRAGIDLVLTTGPGSFAPVVAALAREARRDPAFRTRLRDAAGRTRTLRRDLARNGQ